MNLIMGIVKMSHFPFRFTQNKALKLGLKLDILRNVFIHMS